MGKFLDSVKNKKVDNNKNTSSTTKKVGKFGKSVMESKIGLDTLDTDLKSLGTTVESVYNEWQPEETMNNTKASILTMKERLNAYQEYAKLFGGEDVTELVTGYQSILDDWDDITGIYGQYQNADAYNKVKKNAEFDKRFSHEDGTGYTFEEVQAELEKYSPYSEEYKYLSTYTNYSDLNEINKAIEHGEKKKQRANSVYANEKLDNAIKDSLGGKSNSSLTEAALNKKEKKEPSEFESAIREVADSSYLDELKKKKNLRELEHKVDLYKPEYESKPDFAENSKYVTTYNESKKPDHIFGLGLKYEDNTYEYINDVNGAREEIKFADMAKNMDGNGYVNEWEEKGYHLLREDEIAIYNYKYRVEGKDSAKKFLEDMQPVFDKRRTDELSKYWEQTNEKFPVLTNAATVVVKPAGAVLTMADTVVNAIQGKDYNPYSYNNVISNYVTDTRKYTSDDIVESTEGFELWGQNVPSFLYNTGMSVADSAYGVATLGKFNTVVMGTSAFHEKAREMVEAGEDQDVVYKAALTSGVAEALFEYVGIDNLFKIKSVDSLSGVVKNALKQAGAEGFEEIGTEITNIIADDVIRGKDSELYKMYSDLIARGYSENEALSKTALQAGSQVTWAGIGGALSGIGMGGVAGARNYSNNKLTGSEIRGKNRVGDMLDIASLSPQESDAYEAYTRYAAKGVTADNITDAQLGNLYGVAKADAVSTMLSKKATTEQKADAETTYNRLSKVKTENKVAEIEKELAQVKEEGVATPYTREMVINEQTKGMSKAEAELFRSVDDGHTNAVDYADSFNLVVAMAQNEYDQDYILEHRGVLSTAQVNSIYQAVVTNPKMAQQKRLEALIQEQGDNLEIKGNVDDSVIDYENTGAEGKVNWSDLHSNVKATIAYISGFATKVAGMDVQLVTNGREFGFTGQYDRQGNVMYVDITALAERVKSADTKGRKDNSRFIVSTVAHEVTHWMEEKAPELYAQYSKMVMDALTSNGRTEAEVLGRRRALLEKAEKRRAEKEGRKPREITDKEVRREVIARASEDMLALSEEGKKFFESLTENEQKRFVDKIKEVIQNIKSWIKDVLSKLTSDAPEAVELRALAKDLDAISKKWDEMLREAAKVNAAMKKAGVSDKAIMESKVDVDTQNADVDGEASGNLDKKVYNENKKQRSAARGEQKAETRDAFYRRSNDENLEIKKRRKVAFAFKRTRPSDVKARPQQVKEELTKLGVPCVVVDRFEVNEDGITTKWESEATTSRGDAVYINNSMTAESKEVAGHEAFHFWFLDESSTGFVDVLQYNIDFSSAEFKGFVGEIQSGYFGNEVEVGGDNWAELSEEIYAHIVGRIHAGDLDNTVRQFLYDFDSVKSAWDGLVNYHTANKEDIRYSDIDTESYAPTFYSYMGKTINEIKQEKIGANSVVAYLKGKGVKDDEIKWSGIEAWLDGKKSVTKAELQEFVAGSQLQIGEVTRSTNEDAYNELDELWREYIGKSLVNDFDLESGYFDGMKVKTELAFYEENGYDMPPQDVQDRMAALADSFGTPTKWDEYKLEGGTNYREIVFTMPNSTYTNNAMKAHWGNDAQGVLAHARIQDFDVNGHKMLFIEEIQSDWHNEGAKNGYETKRSKEEMAEYQRLYDAIQSADAYDDKTAAYNVFKEYEDAHPHLVRSGKEIPDAPFHSNYHEFVLKRLIRMAAEEGYDSIGWTTAQIQSGRWSDQYAEGYRIEYDQDIPKFLRKYGKKWGAEVGKEQMQAGDFTKESQIEARALEILSEKGIVQFHWNWSHEYGLAYEQAKNEIEQQGSFVEIWSMPITDSMKNSVLYDGQVMYSDIDEDSEGNKLTAEQKEFFKNSTVRDEDGKLKVMFHGTPNAGFTKFRSGTYFTEHKWYAERYKEQSASSLGYKKTADNPDVYAVYLNIQKPFDTRNPKEAKIFNEEYFGHYGMGTPLMESGLPDWFDGTDLQEFLEEQGYDYDGLILDEGGVGGYGDEVVNRGLSYVVFSPEQVKDVNNLTPTSDPDYRYSDIDETQLDDLTSQLKEKQNQIYSASMELRKFDATAAQDKLNAVIGKKGVTEQELDQALQEYANWEKESGYADASKKLSALKDEERLIRREIQKVEDRLHDELKEQIAHWDEEDVKKYVAKAVRKYRTTARLEKASYLVTTGSMLDFSDGQGYRVKDHREISEILDLPDYAEYSDGMIAFMNMGNIRLQTYGIDVSAMPNAKQFSTLRDIIFTVMRENDEFSVDFSKTDGYSAGSVTYGKGTSTSKIIADIKSYFETGVVPEEQTSIRDFLYSDIDAEVDIYAVLGENNRLHKENKTIREDVERLKERLKLEKQLTHGNRFNENQLDAVAGHIRNLGNSNFSKTELVNRLRDVYTHIATSNEVAWDDLFARFYGIAEDVLAVARPTYTPNDYYANIYKDLRSTEISLSEEQKKYVKSMLGVDYNKAFFGKIKVTDKGIPLNSKWEELAGRYPNEFTETQDLNQVLELLEIYETAKELKEVVEEYNEVERTRWLANEIYNQYWNVSTIRTTADKYDKQIKHLNFEHRNAMKELRDSYNERLEQQKKADRAERSRIFKKLREDHIKELQEIRKSSKERMDKYKEDAARKTRIQSITAQALTLNEWLVKNSKDKHIHESMKGPVVNLLQAIDFSSKRALGMWGGDMKGVPTSKDISLQQALSQVQKMMADASVGKEELVLLYGHELDADIDGMIKSVDNIMRTVGDNEYVLNKMTLDDLTTLDNVVRTIKSAVTQMNKFHIVNHAKGIANLAQEEIIYADKLGKAKVYKDKSLRAGARKLLAWRNINPYYAFKRFGTAGKKVFEAFQDGYDKFAFNIKEIIDFTKATYTRAEVRAWEQEIKSFKLRMPATETEMSHPDYKPQYQEIQMTVAQIMDLYLLSKREAAKAHLLGGGIRVADIETKGGKVISQSEGALLEQREISEIVKSLTPRQIEVADALSKFMNTTTTDWGNEVSMARFGYKAFGEKNYVPMQVDKNNLAVDDETEKNNSLFRLLNMSFTKSLTENASNRLVVSSIFDVFAQHTSDMAKYNALALPVLDAFRWYNYKEKGFKGETAYDTKSVKQAIENAFGKEGQGYITTFLKDLNGQENTSRDTVGKSFFTKAKVAAVGANLRVALLQPTAYFRASANIAPKYLLKSVAMVNIKEKVDLAEKYCGMALWKSLGYFDTNVQRGVADQIKHAETAYDKAIELSMKGAEWGDKVTFGYLWHAAELEIKEKRKDLKVGSDEFYREVGKRLRDIIYSTQVVDSVMTRSEMMRSADGFDKILTTFASEPTISYNMLADAYLQTQLDARELGSKKAAVKKNSKYMARVVVAYTTTNLVAALVESGFDILRDDDDEEMDMEELMKLYLENFATNQSILAKIPWLKEGISMLQGFSSTRMDTQGMQAFANALKQVMKLAFGEGSWGKTIKSGVQAASYLSGLPFYNAYRDLMAGIALLTPEELDEILKDFY